MRESVLKSKPWDKIEAEYRSGQLLPNVIASMFGITCTALTRHATKHGWTRDKLEQMRGGVAAELDARTLLEDPIQRGVALVSRHRVDLTRHHNQLTFLQDKFDQLAPKIETLPQLEVAQRINESMAKTRSLLVPLERKAYNLDDRDGDKPVLEQVESDVERRIALELDRAAARARAAAGAGEDSADAGGEAGPAVEMGRVDGEAKPSRTKR